MFSIKSGANVSFPMSQWYTTNKSVQIHFCKIDLESDWKVKESRQTNDIEYWMEMVYKL